MSPSNLVPNFPGIRRACGTRVRVVSVRPRREADGRTDVVAVVLHSVCVCVLKAAVRPPCPLPCLPCLPVPAACSGQDGGGGRVLST